MSYELELISLRCNKTQETKDEPYIVVNHYIEWGPIPISTGATKPINKRIGFEHEISLELHDANPPSVPNRQDDYIGSIRLSEFEIKSLVDNQNTPQKYDFCRGNRAIGDASYTLIYDLHKV